MEIIHTEPRESEEAAEIVRGLGWLLHNDQLEAGSFAGMCDTALGAGAHSTADNSTARFVSHGEVPVGMIALGIVGPGANAAKFCGRRITPDAIYVLTHGDEGVLYAPANHLFTISCVSHEALDRALQTLAQTPISRFSHTGSLPVPAVFMPPLRRVLDEACMPSPLPDHVLVERAISALCLILTAAGPMPRTSLAARNHQRYVRKVRAYLCDHPGESPGLETLCRVTGVGARTLETAFREVIGLSPLQFSKVRRLNAARHVLANADPEEASVKSVATSHGFFHLGRFARDYKSLFGESPSVTLAASTLSSMLLMPHGKPLGVERISSAGIQVRTGLPAYPAH